MTHQWSRKGPSLQCQIPIQILCQNSKLQVPTMRTRNQTFQIPNFNNLKLKRRIEQLLHEGPTYKTLMCPAQSNTLARCRISPQTDIKYQACVAMNIIYQFDHLCPSRPELQQSP